MTWRSRITAFLGKRLYVSAETSWRRALSGGAVTRWWHCSVEWKFSAVRVCLPAFCSDHRIVPSDVMILRSSWIRSAVPRIFVLFSNNHYPSSLQVLLSQVHRLRALDLLGRFLDLGPWAVSLVRGCCILSCKSLVYLSIGDKYKWWFMEGRCGRYSTDLTNDQYFKCSCVCNGASIPKKKVVCINQKGRIAVHLHYDKEEFLGNGLV